MPKSTKPSLLNFVKERLYPSRRSDEITMVDRENFVRERGDVEMSVTKADLTGLMSAGSNKNSWVMEVFSLFQLEGEWCRSERPGWKWDINVENSFEVVNKDGSGEEKD
jgi:hypothetical protein